MGALIRAAAPHQDMTSPKINGHQLELFAQDFFASLEPAAKSPPPPPQPREELVETGYVRRDAQDDHLLHLTREGRRFLARE